MNLTMTLIFIIIFHAHSLNKVLSLVRLFYSGGIKFSDLSSDEGKKTQRNVTIEQFVAMFRLETEKLAIQITFHHNITQSLFQFIQLIIFEFLDYITVF